MTWDLSLPSLPMIESYDMILEEKYVKYINQEQNLKQTGLVEGAVW